MSKKKRRSFSPECKAEIALTVLTGEKSPAQICREHQWSAQQFSNWTGQFLENAAQVFEKSVAAAAHAYRPYPNRVQSPDSTDPDQGWDTDSTDVRLGREHVYLAVIMDV